MTTRYAVDLIDPHRDTDATQRQTFGFLTHAEAVEFAECVHLDGCRDIEIREQPNFKGVTQCDTAS